MSFAEGYPYAPNGVAVPNGTTSALGYTRQFTDAETGLQYPRARYDELGDQAGAPPSRSDHCAHTGAPRRWQRDSPNEIDSTLGSPPVAGIANSAERLRELVKPMSTVRRLKNRRRRVRDRRSWPPSLCGD
jgi:hypothetical protein